MGFAVEEDEVSLHSTASPSHLPLNNSGSLDVTIGDESEDELANLEPMFSPTYDLRRVSVHFDHAPLFIYLSTDISCDNIIEGKSKNGSRRRSLKDAVLPLCLGNHGNQYIQNINLYFM